LIAIRGAKSAIARSLIEMLPEGESVYTVPRNEKPPMDCERYLFCAGLLRAKSGAEQSEAERKESFEANAEQVIRACDEILAANDSARICVIGSESGFAGSYDKTYAEAKRALHSYVETKKLRTPRQQLVCVAPNIIRDAEMTLTRHDLAEVDRRAKAHPKGRFLAAREVARLIHFLLYVDEGYISGVTIRMNGGAHTAKT